MSFLKKIILGILFLSFISCSRTYPVSSRYEKESNFSSFKTFKIFENQEGFTYGVSPLNKQQIDQSILKEMNALNFNTSDNPDLLVSWFVKVNTAQAANFYLDYYENWKRFSLIDVHYYRKGTLVIDIIDLKNKQIIWHGSTSDKVHEDMPFLKNKIKNGVHSLLEKFAADMNILPPLATNN
jgi:hypothetical protein